MGGGVTPNIRGGYQGCERESKGDARSVDELLLECSRVIATGFGAGAEVGFSFYGHVLLLGNASSSCSVPHLCPCVCHRYWLPDDWAAPKQRISPK